MLLRLLTFLRLWLFKVAFSESACSLVPAEAGADFSCNVCGLRYRSHRSLTQHMKMHEGLTVCQVCGKVSNNRPDLRKHLVLVHRLSSHQVQELVPDGRRAHLLHDGGVRH